jgi:hypothetical protein
MMWKPKNCNKDCVYVNECTIMAEGPYKVILQTSDSKGIISSCVGRGGRNKNYTLEGRRHETEMGQQVAQMHDSYMMTMMMMRGGIGLD